MRRVGTRKRTCPRCRAASYWDPSDDSPLAEHEVIALDLFRRIADQPAALAALHALCVLQIDMICNSTAIRELEGCDHEALRRDLLDNLPRLPEPTPPSPPQ